MLDAGRWVAISPKARFSKWRRIWGEMNRRSLTQLRKVQAGRSSRGLAADSYGP